MGIADVIRILGFTTAETEPLASSIYAEAGQACLRYTGGYIEAVMQSAKREYPAIAEAEIKRIVMQSVLASNFVAMITALTDAGIPRPALAQVIGDVLKFIDDQNQAEQKKPPCGDLN